MKLVDANLKLVDANLKSEKEFANRMMDGEVFYYKGFSHRFFNGYFSRVKLDERLILPIDFGRYKEMLIEAKWDDDIKKPILCWVSDISGNEKNFAALIIGKCGEGYYFEADGARWKYATPVTAEDLS